MKLKKDVILGIDAVVALKNRVAPVTVVQLSQELNVSSNHLEQVMRKLRIAGIVKVKRGPGGGHFINNDTAYSVMDVAKALGSAPKVPQSDGAVSKFMHDIVRVYSDTTL